MTRWTRRLVVVAAAFTAMAVGGMAWLGLEFGSRPWPSVVPVSAASDVTFIEANGIRFGYIEKGTGPMRPIGRGGIDEEPMDAAGKAHGRVSHSLHRQQPETFLSG